MAHSYYKSSKKIDSRLGGQMAWFVGRAVKFAVSMVDEKVMVLDG